MNPNLRIKSLGFIETYLGKVQALTCPLQHIGDLLSFPELIEEINNSFLSVKPADDWDAISL